MLKHNSSIIFQGLFITITHLLLLWQHYLKSIFYSFHVALKMLWRIEVYNNYLRLQSPTLKFVLYIFFFLCRLRLLFLSTYCFIVILHVILHPYLSVRRSSPPLQVNTPQGVFTCGLVRNITGLTRMSKVRRGRLWQILVLVTFMNQHLSHGMEN